MKTPKDSDNFNNSGYDLMFSEQPGVALKAILEEQVKIIEQHESF